jgi:hypothetical protein
VIRSLLTAFALVFVLAPAVRAADVDVTASVSPDEVAVGDAVTLTVSVAGDAGGAEPELPDLPGFRVGGSGSSTSFSFVNGQVSRRAEYSYTLIPEKEGRLSIGPVTVRVRGKRYRTEPVAVNVVPAGSRSRPQPAQPRTAQPGLPGFRFPQFPQVPGFPPMPGMGGQALRAGDVVVDLSADTTDPYVGQQVVLTFRLDRAVDLTFPPDYTPPPTPGFTAHDVETPPGGGREVKIEKGRRHVIEYRRMVLFPLSAGDATVGPAGVTFTVDPFAGGQHLQTDPVTLHVRPLPQAGRPADFAGAVGDFTLSAALDKDHTDAGGAVTLTVKLTGSGNLADIPKVAVNAPDAVEVYDPEIEDHITYAPEGVLGERDFKYVLVPKRAGDLTVGPVRLSAFNPADGQYHALASDPLHLTVAPAPAAAPAQAPAEAKAPAEQASARNTRRDALGGAAVVFLAGLALLIRRLWARRGRSGPVPEAPPPPPPPTAQSLREALETALAEPDDAAFLREADRALRSFLGASWDVPPPRVDADAVRHHMADAPEAERAACLEALEALQAARFAPGSQPLDRQALAARVRDAAAAARAGTLATV